MANRVLIGGGRGFIGRTLYSAMQRRGYDVVVISRTQGSGRLTWKDVERNGLPEGTKAVINLAGRSILEPGTRWTEQFKREVWESRIQTTKLLRDAIVAAPKKPEVFVSSSAIGYYAPSDTEEYTELSAGGDADDLARLCAAWENAAKLPPEVHVRHVVIRIGVVLGRDGGVIQNLYWPFFFGVGGPVSSGKQPFPWIHVGDIARLFVFAVEKPEVEGVLNGVAPELINNAQFAQALGKAMKRPALVPLPEVAVNLMYGEERGKILLEGQKVLPRRTVDAGFTFKYPTIASACQQCVSSSEVIKLDFP